jgi:arylsulfatase A-like enzyme/tetratricopeptide (TPR) repeat protein
MMMKKGQYFTFVFMAFFIIVLFTVTSCKKKAKNFKLPEETDYNLLFLTLDTTRADRIGAYGYANAETPSIDGLAQRGVLFKNCYASVPLTLPSHATLFTGREPIAHGIRNNGTYVLRQEETTLAETMQALGYRTFAVIASFTLHSKFGMSQGFDVYDDSLDFNTAANNIRTEISADKAYAKFKNWFENNHAQKFFSWVHFYDPHSPYDPPPEYKSRFSDDYYDGEIAYTDGFVGRIVEDLRSKGILNKTLIIVAGDHGEAFGEHREFGHGIFCYEESLKVPLIISNPTIFREERRVISQRVRLTDIMPTVLELYGLDVPRNIQGKSLAPPLFGEKENHDTQIYVESLFGKEDMGWAPLTGMILGDHKYISLPTPELYDLTSDPEEKRNLFGEKKSLAKKIDRRLSQYVQNNSNSGGSARRTLTEADRERLESLGYVSPFSGEAKKELDPKDEIDLLNEILAVKKLLDKGNIEDAEKRLPALLESEQGVRIPPFYDSLCNMYKEQGDMDKATEILEKAVQQFPGKKRFRVNLALLHLETGKVLEAERLSLAIVDGYPDVAQAHSILALIYKGKGEIDKAAFYYDKALEIEPSNVMLNLNLAEAELERGNRLKAVELLDPLVQNDVLMEESDSSKVRTRLGILLARGGEYKQAIGLFLRIIEKNEADSEVWTHLGLSYYNKGDFEKARESLDKALAIESQNALALSSLGTLHLSQFRAEKNEKDYNQALEFYRRAIEADPNLASAHNGLAVAYRFANRNDLAVTHWKEAIEAKPDFTNAYINLGITLIHLGQKEKALEYLNRCREKYFSRMSGDDQRQLLELIAEAKS